MIKTIISSVHFSTYILNASVSMHVYVYVCSCIVDFWVHRLDKKKELLFYALLSSFECNFFFYDDIYTACAKCINNEIYTQVEK